MEAKYRLDSHIRGCVIQYIVMAVLLIIGVSSGIWFYSLSGKNILSSPAVLMLQSGCSDFWQCFFALFLPWLLFCLLLLVTGAAKWLYPLGYVMILYNGIVIGSSIEPAFVCGFWGGALIIFGGAAVSLVRCYLLAVNSCALKSAAPVHLQRFSRSTILKLRIYLSCAGLFLVLAVAGSFLILLLNNVL